MLRIISAASGERSQGILWDLLSEWLTHFAPFSFSIFPSAWVFGGHNKKGPHGEEKGQRASARESGGHSSAGPSGSWVTLNESLSLGFTVLIRTRKDFEWMSELDDETLQRGYLNKIKHLQLSDDITGEIITFKRKILNANKFLKMQPSQAFEGVFPNPTRHPEV